MCLLERYSRESPAEKAQMLEMLTSGSAETSCRGGASS
jgi:hypothetical protein